MRNGRTRPSICHRSYVVERATSSKLYCGGTLMMSAIRTNERSIVMLQRVSLEKKLRLTTARFLPTLFICLPIGTSQVTLWPIQHANYSPKANVTLTRFLSPFLLFFSCGFFCLVVIYRQWQKRTRKFAASGAHFFFLISPTC